MNETSDWYSDEIATLAFRLATARTIEDESLNRSTQARLVQKVADAAERRSLEESSDDMRLYDPGLALLTMLEDATVVDALRYEQADEPNLSILRSLIRINLATARTCPQYDIDKRAHGLLEDASRHPQFADHLLGLAISIDATDKDIVYARIACLPGLVSSGGGLSMQQIDLIYVALGPALASEILGCVSDVELPVYGKLAQLRDGLSDRLLRRPQFLPLLAAAAMAVETRSRATLDREPLGFEREMPNLARQYAESAKHFGWAVVLAAREFGFTEKDLGPSLDAWSQNWHYNDDFIPDS
jgi:hypothetical protein